MSLILKGLKLSPDLIARIEAHGAAHKLKGFTASAVDLIERGLTGRDGSAVLDALPKGPPPSPPSQGVTRDRAPVRSSKTQAAPVMGRTYAAPAMRVTPAPATPKAPARIYTGARVSEIEGLQDGPIRPAYGSMLKGPKVPKGRR